MVCPIILCADGPADVEQIRRLILGGQGGQVNARPERREWSLSEAGGHLLMMSMCAIGAEGAPSLRFLHGRVTMLPTQLLWLRHPLSHAFQVPALCKVRKGRGTYYVF